MKLAVLAPPEIPLPIGDGYGGIELIAQDFGAALAAQGHDVHIYCRHDVSDDPDHLPMVDSGPNSNRAAILYYYPETLGPIGEDYDYTFDFTHQKAYAQNYQPSNYAATTFLTDHLSLVNDVFPSKAVRDGFPDHPGTLIYPGIRDVYTYSKEKDDFLLFLGRIAPYKRPDIALQVARLSGHKAVVAGHVGKFSSWPDPGYADRIRSMVDGDKAVLVENPTLEWKCDLLSRAKALVVPSDWSSIGSQESFGLVAVEALLSGTPVITSGDGGLKEIVTPEVGAVCHSLADYLLAVQEVEEGKYTPTACKARGEYFTSGRMAKDYLEFAEKMKA